MKKLHFVSGGRSCTAQLPHCAVEVEVLAAVSVAQSNTSAESRLFVFDTNCAPTHIRVEEGMTVRWRWETDTFFLRGASGKEHRVLSDQTNEAALARLLSGWRSQRVARTGLFCHDDTTGEALIVDIRTLEELSFDRDSSIPPIETSRGPSSAEL